jgi:PHS family inorganic phosphate transporter-like MFS transporter
MRELTIVVPMIGFLYFQDQKGVVSAVQGDEIKGSFSLGMIVGQLGFGFLGDALGRKTVYGKELLVLITGTLMTILLPWKGLSKNGVVAWLAVFRMLSGIGAGGGEPQPPKDCNVADSV